MSRPESISNDSRSHQHPPLPAHPGGATEGHEAMPEPHPQRGQEGSDEAPTAEARSVPGVAYDASKETAAVPAVSPPADPSDYYKGGIPTDIALTASQPPPPPQTPFERGSLSEGSSGADSPSETAQGASTAALSSSGADVLRAADEGARGEELGGGREEKAVNRTMTREGGAERASEGAQEGLAVERGQAEAEAEIERLRQQRDEMEDALLRALR